MEGKARAGDAEAPPGRPPHPLFGGWSATRWEYASLAAPDRIVDVVTDLGGSVALSLTATAFILAFDVAGRGQHSVAGTGEVRGDELWLQPEGAEAAERVAFHLAGDTLSLRSGASGWDFDGTGQEEAAAFVAVLVRL
jgi:hypothetical protein